MSDTRVSRRTFLALLGVLVGAGAAGRLAWLRLGNGVSSSAAVEGPASAGMTSSTTAATSGSRSTGAPAPTTTEISPASASAPGSEAKPNAATSTPSDVSTTTTEPPATPVAGSSTTAGASAGVKHEVQVICREAWGAAPIQGQLVGHRIERLTVHHSGVAMGMNAEAPRRMRSYQSYHQESGWPDIAYHYVVDANGHVYEGRPVSVRGDTFTEYDPTGHFLLCCDGHFDLQGIPDAQMSSLAGVLAWACAQFGVDPATIAGHRDYAATTCPGSQLAGLMADGTLRSMVERRIASGGVPISLLCGPVGVDRVAAIEAGRL